MLGWADVCGHGRVGLDSLDPGSRYGNLAAGDSASYRWSEDWRRAGGDEAAPTGDKLGGRGDYGAACERDERGGERDAGGEFRKCEGDEDGFACAWKEFGGVDFCGVCPIESAATAVVVAERVRKAGALHADTCGDSRWKEFGLQRSAIRDSGIDV